MGKKKRARLRGGIRLTVREKKKNKVQGKTIPTSEQVTGLPQAPVYSRCLSYYSRRCTLPINPRPLLRVP